MLPKLKRLKRKLDIKLENAVRSNFRKHSTPTYGFIPEYGVDPTQSRTRFPDYLVVLEDSDLVRLLSEAQSQWGYKPERIEQTAYDGNSGHIRLISKSGGHGMATSEVIDQKSQTLLYRLYIPLNEVVQVSRPVVSR